jgi:outer membrane receptor protein involved in Fe transport
VTFADVGTIPGYANFTIRGVGINTSIPSVEPAVGVFVDGIYLGMSAGAVLDLFDVEDVEILRGPQATLFGRNTTGGAVLINTRRPGDTFSVRGRASVETGLQETFGFSVEGPIADRLKAKVVAYYNNDAGWFKNQFDGQSFGATHTSFVRPTIVWSPTQDVDATLIYERGATRGNGAVVQNPAYFHHFTVDIDNPVTTNMTGKRSPVRSIGGPGRALLPTCLATAAWNKAPRSTSMANPGPCFTLPTNSTNIRSARNCAFQEGSWTAWPLQQDFITSSKILRIWSAGTCSTALRSRSIPLLEAKSTIRIMPPLQKPPMTLCREWG